jgi:predicted MPP superfamily phosphohydrolase
MNTITWLHLSDLHASPTRTGWDANRVIKSLVDDLKQLHRDYKLRPDLIFFTGDAAFGQLGESPGNSLQDQYKIVQQFLDEVREAFRPALKPRDIYLVPGNHDVNRDDIDETQTAWLRDPKRTLDEILAMMQAGKTQWRRFMERLEDYELFLTTNGYSHLLTEDKNLLIYADEREIAGLRIGIAGLNSAWSCYGGEQDKGKIWTGGKFQIEALLPRLSKAHFSIALTHHPGNWFVPQEDPAVQQLLEHHFQFYLHGHEHHEWVRTNSKTGHTVISAGASYESSQKSNGFNLVQLDLKTGEGKVWLREYKESGRGWVASNINTFAPKGIWTLDGLKWFQRFKPARTSRATTQSSTPPREIVLANETESNVDSGLATLYEHRFHEFMVRKYDYLELFGADIPKEAKRHSLSVAYVSLNLCQDEPDLEVVSKKATSQLSGRELPFIGARPVAEVFDLLGTSSGRLLVRGVAGGGKSTLLRWAAMQCAKANLKVPASEESIDEVDSRVDTDEDAEPEREQSGTTHRNWRKSIPFLIRLRDYTDGRLPRPKEWSSLVAKALPDPPSEWIDDVLNSGRALVLLDGVDEVPSQKREILARDIEDLVGTYPQNY